MDRKNIYKVFYGFAVLLAVGFCVGSSVDFYQYDEMSNSAPFRLFVAVRGLSSFCLGLFYSWRAGQLSGNIISKSGQQFQKFERVKI